MAGRKKAAPKQKAPETYEEFRAVAYVCRNYDERTYTTIRIACPRLCIDDMCHGCREDTLCGGSYCHYCDGLTSGSSVCDGCREVQEDDEIDAEAPTSALWYES